MIFKKKPHMPEEIQDFIKTVFTYSERYPAWKAQNELHEIFDGNHPVEGHIKDLDTYLNKITEACIRLIKSGYCNHNSEDLRIWEYGLKAAEQKAQVTFEKIAQEKEKSIANDYITARFSRLSIKKKKGENDD